MVELIKIEKKNEIDTVNARNLHIYLECGDRFDQWIKRRIDKYHFVENKDFCTELCKTSGRPYTEYYLSIDMAKELSMVENNQKGRSARRYFIEVEKRARQITYQSEDEILHNAFLILDSRVKKLEQKIEEDRDKVQFFNDVTGSKDAVEMGKVAKLLDCGIGRNKLFQLLRDNKILMLNNEPYQKYIDYGWFRVIEQKYEPKPGEVRINIKTLVYQKGINGISKIIRGVN